MKKINLLVPSVNRPTHPSLCKCFRENGEREVRLVGIDMQRDGIGRHIVDVFYQVPPRNDPSYLKVLLDICDKEKIGVYYALSEDEAILAALNKDAFASIGTNVITPGSPEMLSIATNKCLWHDFFAANHIPHANYRNIDSWEMIAVAAVELGYPQKDVIFKPAVSKGGRGARIITARDISQEYYANNSGEPQMSLDAYLELLKSLSKTDFKRILAMEYLPGTYYSVDVLSSRGQIIYAIPKIRIAGSASNTTVGQVDLNKDAIELAAKACKAFNFSYMQNYEMKLNNAGKPMVYDINPRGGASVALCKAAGVNLAYFAVKMALGEPIPEVEIKDKVKMIRFYDEYYE